MTRPKPPPVHLPKIPLVADRPAPSFGYRPQNEGQTLRLERRRIRIAVALSGGGANYVALAGAMSVLLEQPWLEVVALSGTSAGALCAALVSGRRHQDELLWDIVRRTLPGSKINLDASIPSPPDWAIYSDKDLVRTLRAHLTERMGHCYFPTAITTVQLFPTKERVWSSWDTPNVDLSSAVRGSISIPFAFKPAHIGRWEGGRIKVIATNIVDGGLSSNLPVDDIDWPVPFDQIWALDVRNEQGQTPDFSMPWGLGAAVVDAVVALNEREDIQDARSKYGEKFGLISLSSDASASFHITTKRAKRMWRRGRREAKIWVQRRYAQMHEDA